ncbi:hypothetical protein QE152_g39467 [Popillia japonica]|uniref:SGNH hydrolase-type esterase domain-containing protein n=1 Tax=Popillia japonica TaxID=7064 RepID=A0AAW1HU04_POPJA
MLGRTLNEATTVLGIVKPGAGIDILAQSLQDEVKNLGKTDTVIVMAGSNNMSNCYDSDEIHKVVDHFRFIMDHTRHTNAIINTIPFTCFDTGINKIIEHINYKIFNLSKQYDHVNVLCINNIIYLEDYIRDGFHLKTKAKKLV